MQGDLHREKLGSAAAPREAATGRKGTRWGRKLEKPSRPPYVTCCGSFQGQFPSLPEAMFKTPRQRALLVPFASLLLFGCTDRDLPTLPTAPEPPPAGTIIAAIECRVTVADGSMGCAQLELPPEMPGISPTVILGGQNTYVKVSTVSASYDGGAQVFTADMTV